MRRISTSLKSGFGNRFRLLKAISTQDSSFSTVVDCCKKRIKDEKRHNLYKNCQKSELNVVLYSFSYAFLESNVHHGNSTDFSLSYEPRRVQHQKKYEINAEDR